MMTYYVLADAHNNLYRVSDGSEPETRAHPADISWFRWHKNAQFWVDHYPHLHVMAATITLEEV